MRAGHRWVWGIEEDESVIMIHRSVFEFGKHGADEENMQSLQGEYGEGSWQSVKEQERVIGGGGIVSKMGVVVMGAVWRHASLPPPAGLVSLSCKMKSCN